MLEELFGNLLSGVSDSLKALFNVSRQQKPKPQEQDTKKPGFFSRLFGRNASTPKQQVVANPAVQSESNKQPQTQKNDRDLNSLNAEIAQ